MPRLRGTEDLHRYGTLWRERWLAPADIGVDDLSIEEFRATGDFESWDSAQ